MAAPSSGRLWLAGLSAIKARPCCDQAWPATVKPFDFLA
jgi:hypothetical protein